MKLGAQLYTIRDFCKDTESLNESLKKVAEIGYKYIQLSGFPYDPVAVKKTADELGLDTGLATESGVVTVVIGNSVKCLKLSKYLFDHGVNANPILHPAVEEKAARIRFFLTCSHTEEEMRLALELTAAGLAEIAKEDVSALDPIFGGGKKK